MLFLLISSLLGLIAIINLIRRGYLELRYSFLWLFVGVVVVGLAIFPEIMRGLSQILGIETPANTLFLIGFYFVLCLLMSMTVIVSRQYKRIKILGQEIAMLRQKVEEKNE